MILLPVNPTDKIEEHHLKNAGAVEANESDRRELFAKSYLRSQGFFTDNNISQITKNNLQLPLLTYPFIDYLLSADLSGRNLVELGSGNSTVLFSKLFSSVISYETDATWLEQTKNKVGINTEIRHIAKEDLESAQFNVEDIDCLLVDFAGKRTKFLENYFRKVVRKAPVIFLDNSDMYRNGVRLLMKAGYQEIPFYGLKSGQTWLSCTSMFLLRLECAPSCDKFISNNYTRNSHKNAWDSLD